VILRGVESLHVYVQDNLRPAISGALLEDNGLLEAMSCTALARAAMAPAGPEGKEDFGFRRVALGARSPDLEAVGLERDFIERFQEDPAREWGEAIIWEGGKEYLVLAQPVRYQGFCLRCHGDPSMAPRDLVEAYGAERGFHRKEGELAGAHVVRLPMEATVARIQGATLGFVLMFSLGAIFLFATIYVFFNRLVVHNLRRGLEVMGRHFPEAVNQVAVVPKPEPAKDAPDEIEQVLSSMEHFAGSLRQARAQLQSYAATLEERVQERTEGLAREAEERRADVGLFVSLLDGLNRTRDRKEILDGCLGLIARRFRAERATYCCAIALGTSYSWPEQPGSIPMPQAWERMAAKGEFLFRNNCAFVPVQTSGAAQGMLSLTWRPGRNPDPMPVEVLMAVGQQLGVVMENMEALDSLLRQNGLLQAVFEGIADPVVLLDGRGQVVLANASAKGLALPEREPALPGAALLCEAMGILPGRTLPPAVLSGPAVREVVLPGERTFLASLYPLPEFMDPGGRLVAYAREVTEERRMRELAQQNEKLLAVGRLAAGLAHEINNPLGVILFYGELLKGLPGLGQGREDVEVILRHTRQAQKVLRDLLDFVRPKKSATGPCDLAETARRTVSVYQAQASAEGKAMALDVPADLPLVDADAMALEQILSNLLINALDAVEPGMGRIAVSAAREDDRVVLRVADNGPGIPKDVLGRIFDPFFTTKEVGKGTGLGLAVVFGLVNDMGGSVEAANAAGAVFSVRLPLAGAREVKRAAA